MNLTRNLCALARAIWLRLHSDVQTFKPHRTEFTGIIEVNPEGLRARIGDGAAAEHACGAGGRAEHRYCSSNFVFSLAFGKTLERLRNPNPDS